MLTKVTRQNKYILPIVIFLILILGLLIRFAYLSYTDFKTRTYDVTETGGHLDYINYIIENSKLPPADQGWEFHQPPFYYIVGVFAKFLSIDSEKDFNHLLQLFSLFFFSCLLVIGIIIFFKVFKGTSQRIIATVLLVFWPSGIIHSVRIGNDVFSYLFYSLTFFFLLLWILEKKIPYIILAFITTAVTLFSKKTGFILLPLLGVFALFHSHYYSHKKSQKLIIGIILITLVFIAYLSIYRNLSVLKNNPRANWITGEIYINKDLYVGNRLKTFLAFNPILFVQQPYTSTWDNNLGRNYFWQFFLKSLLFAEFQFNLTVQSIIACILSALLLYILIIMSIGLTLYRYKNKAIYLLFLLNLLFSLLFLLLFRFKEPYASNQDFRYIFPSIFSIIFFFMNGIRFFEKKQMKIVTIINYTVPNVFTLLSVVFFYSSTISP